MSRQAENAKRKPAQSEGASDRKAPQWLIDAGGPVKEGGYQYISRTQLQCLQRPYQPLKAQVWATLILHTAKYGAVMGGEVAVTMIPKEWDSSGRVIEYHPPRYLTSTGIASELAKAAETY